MTVTVTTPRVYLASLTDYNAGTLHGCWVDATDADEMHAACQAMLADSPEHAAFPEGSPSGAEEWAIHDYEGFHGYRLHEYTSLDRVALIGAALDEADDPDALVAWLAMDDSEDIDDRIADFSDHYQGRISPGSEREWAQQWADDFDLIPEDAEWPWYCIDWEHAAEALQLELSCNSGWSFIETAGGDTIIFNR